MCYRKLKKLKMIRVNSIQRNYRIAQLLVSIAKNKDSLPYFEAALQDLRPERESFVWGDLYCNAVALYAVTLDSVNDIEKASAIFEEVCTYKPDGCHIGDYAMFLHKRKKDNKKAERWAIIIVTLLHRYLYLFTCMLLVLYFIM